MLDYRLGRRDDHGKTQMPSLGQVPDIRETIGDYECRLQYVVNTGIKIADSQPQPREYEVI